MMKELYRFAKYLYLYIISSMYRTANELVLSYIVQTLTFLLVISKCITDVMYGFIAPLQKTTVSLKFSTSFLSKTKHSPKPIKRLKSLTKSEKAQHQHTLS